MVHRAPVVADFGGQLGDAPEVIDGLIACHGQIIACEIFARKVFAPLALNFLMA